MYLQGSMLKLLSCWEFKLADENVPDFVVNSLHCKTASTPWVPPLLQDHNVHIHIDNKVTRLKDAFWWMNVNTIKREVSSMHALLYKMDIYRISKLIEALQEFNLILNPTENKLKMWASVGKAVTAAATKLQQPEFNPCRICAVCIFSLWLWVFPWMIWFVPHPKDIL